ncbi:MAG: hypothetical protein KGL52_01160 [Rhodospirillales bacterium]|nr:hypothetical protein [Rhodospirillales bacterium]
MTKTNDPPKQRGGKRPGAGRPKGARSATTIERERNARAAVDLVLAEIGREGIKRMQPLEVLMLGMHLALEAGNLPAAMAAAEKAAPFCHARMSSVVAIPPVPPELEPDPAPVPDEPGPQDSPDGS